MAAVNIHQARIPTVLPGIGTIICTIWIDATYIINSMSL